MIGSEWSAARLVALAAGLTSVGVLISGDPLGVLVGAPVLLAAILRAFRLRDPGGTSHSATEDDAAVAPPGVAVHWAGQVQSWGTATARPSRARLAAHLALSAANSHGGMSGGEID